MLFRANELHAIAFTAVVMCIDDRPYLSLRQHIIIMRKLTTHELASFSASLPSESDQPAAHDPRTEQYLYIL